MKSPPKYFVIICREGVTEVVPFEFFKDAYAFFKGPTTESWGESFLTVVVDGPFV